MLLNRVSGRLGVLLLLGLVIGWGSWIRLANLGEERLEGDELNHYYAAASLARGDGPLLPSGREFRRGLDITWMVGKLLPRERSPELAVRLPSAIFGVLNLILVAVIAWRLGGPWAAIWTTLLFAMYPDHVSQSRHGRFYTYQLAFGLVALYAGWRTVCTAGDRESPTPRELRRTWTWATLTVVMLLLAVRISVVSLSVAAGWGVCLAIAAAADLSARGIVAWRRSVPTQLTVTALSGILIVTILRSDFVASLLRTATSVPYWALATGEASVLYYYDLLSGQFPLLVSLTPLVYLMVWFRDRRLGGYLFAWFGLPLLLHSFLLPWKGDRYILLATPGLLVAGGIAAAAGAAGLSAFIRRMLGRQHQQRSVLTAAPIAVTTLLSIGVILTTPAFNFARKAPRNTPAFYFSRTPPPHSDGPRWDQAGRIIRERTTDPRIPVGSSLAEASLLYWGEVDFTIEIGALHQASLHPSGKSLFEWKRPGAIDTYSGVPILTTPAAIREHFADVGAVIVAIDSMRLLYRNVEPELVQTLSAQGVELCQGQCGSMVLYLWRFRSER
jgi:hypothetical protein